MASHNDVKKNGLPQTETSDADADREEDLGDENCWSRAVQQTQNQIYSFFRSKQAVLYQAIKALLLVAYLGYFAFCMYYRFGDEGSIVFLVITVVLMLVVASRMVPAESLGCCKRFSLAGFTRLCGGSARVRKLRMVCRW